MGPLPRGAGDCASGGRCLFAGNRRLGTRVGLRFGLAIQLALTLFFLLFLLFQFFLALLVLIVWFCQWGTVFRKVGLETPL